MRTQVIVDALREIEFERRTVLDRLGDSTMVTVETIRLERLLTNWMELERRRAPFLVAKLEEKRSVEIGGMHLEIRADRVDELPDGRQVILDYKTGNIKSQSWQGPRIDEPQVPLYCVSTDGRVAAAGFAQIRVGESGLCGISDVPMPDFETYKDYLRLSEQIVEWRSDLAGLAKQFGDGDARVDPKYGSKTCEFCAIVPLCRIREYDHG